MIIDDNDSNYDGIKSVIKIVMMNIIVMKISTVIMLIITIK